MDDDFGEEYGELLRRFYLLFESVYKYITDFNKYIEASAPSAAAAASCSSVPAASPPRSG